MARRSRITGVNKFRRKLRRFEPEILREIQDPLRDGANRIARDQRSMAPRDEGDLINSIDVKLSRDKLTAVIGPGVKAAEIVRKRTGSVFGTVAKGGKNKGQKIRLSKSNKKLMFDVFKALWAEFGTKGNAEKNIPAQPARPFTRPAYEANKAGITKAIASGVNKALRRAASG